jgi:hypothetical protein
MSERGIHYVESDLDETWILDWIGVGLVELAAYLDKHTAFVEYLRAPKQLVAWRQITRLKP